MLRLYSIGVMVSGKYSDSQGPGPNGSAVEVDQDIVVPVTESVVLVSVVVLTSEANTTRRMDKRRIRHTIRIKKNFFIIIVWLVKAILLVFVSSLSLISSIFQVDFQTANK